MAALPAGTPSTASALYSSQISSWTEACLRFFFFASLISYTFFFPSRSMSVVFLCICLRSLALQHRKAPPGDERRRHVHICLS